MKVCNERWLHDDVSESRYYDYRSNNNNNDEIEIIKILIMSMCKKKNLRTKKKSDWKEE